MTPTFTESVVEDAALAWLSGLGYTVLHGPEIAWGMPHAERGDPNYRDVVLEGRLRGALAKLNPGLPPDALEDAFRKVMRVDAPSLVERNRLVHRLLVDGVTVEYRRKDGSIAGAQARLIDFDRPDNNDWIAANQFTVCEGQHTRRPDVVLFVNGLPLAVIELKNPADENATVWSAYHQLQTYQAQIPALFASNAALVVSDGVQARIGALAAGQEWFKPWRTIGGREDAPVHVPELQVVLEGVFERRRFLDLLRHFIVFEDSGGGKVTKKMAGYHQFHAVNVAVEETLRAATVHGIGESPGRYEAGHKPGGERGDRRVGVVWHTQGSGKSLTMAFYAGRVILHPAMKNPTIVVITDRNDLDDQLFGTFARCSDLLRQPPVQAADRADLREKLRVGSGGVVFTTIQKFFPETDARTADPVGALHAAPTLSDRRNIVVIADEAHRSQYDFVDGFARHMRDALPNASFIGFTGTPIEQADANTRAVFGDYISVYDIQRAVIDGATVPIYYESRLAKLELKESERPKIDPEFEEATEGEEVERKEQLKTKWAQLEAVVGSENRIKLVARDLVEHFENRLAAMDGKAMVVCMSRRICVELYREIAALRPGWQHDDDSQGCLKVVMTGSATDPLEWQPHIRNKPRREVLAQRFRDPKDPFRIVIVRDMWLTGFDAPSLHTMYVDKPMRGVSLMQAITRVNRTFKDKPAGLIVDYIGIAEDLKDALADYTKRDQDNAQVGADIEKTAIPEMLKEHDIVVSILAGFGWRPLLADKGPKAFLHAVMDCVEWLLDQEHTEDALEGVETADEEKKPLTTKQRFVEHTKRLRSFFSLVPATPEATRIRDDVAYFDTVRAAIAKIENAGRGATDTAAELDTAIRQIVSENMTGTGVVDIYAEAGIANPDISLIDDAFVKKITQSDRPNVQMEALKRLLNAEIKAIAKRNIVKGREFSDMLNESLLRYQNRSLDTAAVVAELVRLAQALTAERDRGQQTGLSDNELAFYDALRTNESAVEALQDDVMKQIAHELTEIVRRDAKTDWAVKEQVRAKLRSTIRRLLLRHGYPPDKAPAATELILKQAEVMGSSESR